MKRYTELTMDNLVMRGYEQHVDDSMVVVMFHGFTGHKTESSGLFRKLADQLEQAGISTIRYDWFGHGESDLTFDQIRVPLLIRQGNEILDDAFRRYRHVCLLGFSMGGAFAMHLVSNDIDRLILMAPAVNMKHIATDFFTDDGTQTHDVHGFVLHREFAEGFVDLDLMTPLEQYERPILFLQGEQDMAVSKAQTEALHARLQHSELMVLEGADHCFSSHDYHMAIASRIITFLKR